MTPEWESTSRATWSLGEMFSMGGHNIAANAVLFYSLKVGIALTQMQNDFATMADR